MRFLKNTIILALPELFIILLLLIVLKINKDFLIDIRRQIAPFAPLYSTISLIFSIISGFIIQTKWQMWNSLIDASRGEIDSLRQLNLLSFHFSAVHRDRIQHDIITYLKSLTEDNWENSDLGIRAPSIEQAIYALEDTIITASEKSPKVSGFAFNLLSKLMQHREFRLQYGSRHLPFMLKNFLYIATTLVVACSFAIGSENLIIDLIFTIAISLLALGIHVLIDDLDHPYRPGNWHLSTDEYEDLLVEIASHEDLLKYQTS